MEKTSEEVKELRRKKVKSGKIGWILERSYICGSLRDPREKTSEEVGVKEKKSEKWKNWVDNGERNLSAVFCVIRGRKTGESKV
ncbi:hypothetical protein RM553_11750 [Zunongwangia sp. F363]|uniref:Uncharacterized protein n=1 Tax=Autumnicola tepida TaxID=3075595 RepID=A0ABU3CAY5_9FLAO|nr:hypothetical protein [Zunongwangia sp. F363]MDT0643507.1 hypothetical protein [Zunongwangia sp. F363]